jgi:alanine-synthesizing transaminase
VVRAMPAEANEEFLRSLDRAVRHSIPKPIAVVLNYPANPTAYTADLDFYKEVVKYCKEQGIFILSDLAYSEIYFDDNNPPPSVLQIPGAIDITVEFTSMSKTYSMPGWRVGFAVGNERLIAALARVKSYLDYGAFTPIQVAATAALNGSDDVIAEVRKIYKNRRDVMVESFARSGWNIPVPAATMFAWAPIPAEFAHLGSLEFAKLLIRETGVGVAPGVGFGEYGDQYIRLAFVENEQRIRQAARNVKKLFGSKSGSGNVVNLAG